MPPACGARRPDFVGRPARRRSGGCRRASQASGLVVTKYALTSWTVKAVDRATGEEIYHDTTLPSGDGSYATEEEALKAIGTRVADRVLARVLPVARRAGAAAASRSSSKASPTRGSPSSWRASWSACPP